MDNLIRIYESTEKAFTSGGLGCLSDATKCIVAEERNGEYELELEYPINGIHYSDIAIRRIILCRPNPYDDPQPFRIYSISKPISGIVTVNAAHVCYDLSNYVCLPFIATTSAEVFQRLNGYATGSETSRIYPPGIIYNASTNPYGFRFTTDMNVSFPPKAQSQKPEPEDERFKVLIPKSIKAVLGDASDCILGRFINSQGHRGEYYYNRFHVYLKDPDGSSPRGATRGFEIRYGKNMTDVEKEETSKDDYTHILPFWKSVQSQDTTIAILGGDGQTAPVVAVPGSAGRTDIKIKIVDLSSEFDKSPTATKLTQYAHDYISENELTGQPSVNITVNFQSVANSSEYSAYSKLEEVRLCDKVKVIYEALGIVDEKKVIRYEYNVLKCAYDEIEIGDPKDELANTISGTSQVTMNTQSVGETVKNGLVETITNAIKLSQTIYYVDTTGTYTEANPPAPPEDWVIDTIQTKGKPNVWTATEPESTDKGNVFTYSQNRLTDDTVNLSDFSLANIATTVRNIVDPNDPTKVHGDNLTDDSVDTPKITDEAITSTKLAADAVQSRTYTAGSDPYYSSEGTLINLAGEGFIRAKNFSIDPNGNVHLRGTVTATAGYLGTEQNGFAIESNALTGTYVRSGDAYAVTLTTDGSLVMRPVPFDIGESYRSSVLSDGILRLSAYNDNIGTAGRIDVDSANMGMTFYKYSATTAENLENYAINGQNGTAIGSIEVLNTNNTSIMSTTGTWQLSGDTYISGHTNQTIKEWIESIEAGGIAPATTSTLGGVIIGSGLSVAANGLLTVDTNTIATRSWANSTFAKPSDIKTYTGTEPITVSSANVIGINYSTGLTLGDGSALEVDLTTNSPIASKTWVGQQGYLTSIPTASSTTKGGVKVDATGGLSVTNEVLKVNLGTGLEFGNSTNVIQVIDYTNLAKKSEIPTVNNATLTIQRNGTTVKTFTANASSNVTANITVPTKTSDLTNDSGFLTSIPTAGTNTIGGVKIPASSVISNTNGALDVKYGTGLDVDDDNNLVIASTVALKSDIPTVNNATLTIQKNGTTVKTFTANASSNVTANIEVPTKTSDLTNDSGFITGVAWSAVTSKPFNTVGDGLEVDTNKILKVKAGNGIKIDSDADNGVAVDLSASDIPTLTSAKISDFDSAVDTALGIGSGSTFLRKDGTWATPTNTTYTGEKGITVSSANKIGHTSTYTAKSTQAVYPITIDTYGHIATVGNAVTIPTIPGADRGISLVNSKYGHSNTAIDAVTTQGMYKVSFDAYGHIDGYTAVAKADITGLGIPGSDTNTTYSLAVNGTGTNANKLGLTAGGSGSGTTWVTVPYATSAGSASSVAWANVTGHDAGVDADLGINASSGDTTKFLNAKGGWAVPYTHPAYTSATAAAVKVGRDATGHVVIGNALTAADVGALSSSTTYVSKITTTAGSHTAITNASGAVSFKVPTKTSHLTNDSGYLTSVSWTGVGSKPFNTIDEQKGLEVTSNALGVKYGTGLTIDSETGELEIDSTVALKTDIKTYTGEKGITVSSSNAVGHTNTYTAKTTQAVYPIKIDTYGHISAVGSAVTIPTIPGADRGISLANSKYGHSNTAIDAVTTQGMYKISFDAYGHIDAYTAIAKADITGLGIPSSDTNTTYSLAVNGTGTNANKLGLTAGGSGSGTTWVTVPYATSAGSAGSASSVAWANVSGHDAGVDSDLGISSSGSTTKFLTQKGTWVTPTGTVYSAGDGITVSGTVISAKYGTGLTTDGNDALAVDTTTIALKSDIKTYTAGTGIAISSANAISNSGVRAVTINGNNLRVNTNGTNADLTIPYATSAGSAPASDVYAWAKAATKPSYTASEVGALSSSTTYVSKITTSAGAHTAISNASGAVSFNVPTKTSHLTNDSGFLTSHQTIYEENINWGPTNVHKLGNVSPIGMALSSEHSANRLAFINGDALTIEYSSDGGATYTNYNYTATQKSALFTTSSNIPIGRVSGNYSTSSRTRITLTAQDGTHQYVYTDSKKLLIYVSISGGLQVLIEYRSGTNYKNNGAWSTYGTYTLAGWSGWNDIPFILTVGGGASQTSQTWQVRFTFIITSFSSSYPTTAHLFSIRMFGTNSWSVPSNLARTGHLYSYDNSQNVTFPANIAATTFNSYTLAAACAKAVDTSISAGSTSTNLPTSKAVATFVEGKGYLTSVAWANVTGHDAGVDSDLGISSSGSTTKYLTQKGTWATPTGTTYSAGDGITVSGTTISVAYGTGLTTDGNDALAVDTNTIATQSWVTGKGYITSSGNTWRPVKYGSTTVNDKTTTLEFVAGNAIDLAFASGKLTINHESYGDAVTTQGLYKISIDKYGHVDGYTAYTDQDTKNTAGSTDTSSKIFLIGATSQAANPQTYSHDTCYVGTNGHLYSANKEVLVGGSNAASTVTITPSTTSVYSMSSAGSVTNGTAPSFTRGTFSGGSLSFAMDTTDTRKLKITFTAATHAADSFSAGTTPPVVTLPGRTQVTGLWNGYTAATAAAQTFTGAKS